MGAGTENVPGIVGLAKAMEINAVEMENIHQHIEKLRSHMIKRLTEEIPGVAFNGDYLGRYLYTVLSVSFPPTVQSNLLLFNLDIAGIAASGGSACSSGSNKGSHVLTHLKVNPDRANIRFSFSKYNTLEEDEILLLLREDKL